MDKPIYIKRIIMLEVKNLHATINGKEILKGINLVIKTGEVHAIMGPNGSGKSTILRCLIGADRPSDGRVEIFGNKVNEADAQFRQDVATVVDDLDFFPDLSVVEHLDLLARAHGLEDPDDLVDSVLEEVNLVPQSSQLPGTLSSGQRRRLALATAFVRPKKLLVLDEPEQRLDVEGVAWLGQRLKHEVSKGLAVVMASHEPSLVEAVGARLVRVGSDAQVSESLVEDDAL